MRHELAQSQLWVIGVEQRPLTAMTRALQLLLDSGFEIDDPASRRQVLAILRQQYGAAAGRDDHVLELRQRVDHLAFALAESGLAFALENVRDVHAGATFHLDVAVVEFEMQQLGQLPTDCGLAGAHRAYQINVAIFGHAETNAAALLRPRIVSRSWSRGQ